MKKLHTSVLFLLTMFLLSGCTVPSVPASSATYPHEPVKGTYAGKIIEMSYAFISDVNCDQVDFYKIPYRYVNDYIILHLNNQLSIFMDKTGKTIGGSGYDNCRPFDSEGNALIEVGYGSWATIDTTGKILGPGATPVNVDTRPVGASRNIGEELYLYDGDALPDGYTLLGLMDKNGNKLTEPIFKNAGVFENGLCFAKLAEGEHKNVIINAKGDIVGRAPDANDWATIMSDHSMCSMAGEPGAYYFQMYDFSGNFLNETHFDFIGDVYNGLALILQDGKIGLIDVDGKVVIPPVFDYDKISYDRGTKKPWIFDPTYMDEDIILIPINGKIGALKITRS